jgi:superoxide dismutase, Fe-Mn family
LAPIVVIVRRDAPRASRETRRAFSREAGPGSREENASEQQHLPQTPFGTGDCQHKESAMTIITERRSFIQAAGFVAAASTAALAASPSFAQGNQPGGAKPMPYQAKPLSLDPKSIKGISEKVLVSHYENNYVGAVKRLNAIGTQLAELDFAKAPNFMVNGLKREELIAANSMILHEIYFDGLGGGAGASGPLAEAIARDFGSLERWRTEFSAMGKAEGGGSGWVILSYSPRDKRLVNQWAADHTTTLAGGRPVLVLDMYEHAYHMDYGAAAARYVDIYMEAIRWDNAAKLYDQYTRES